jgi:hypothetical protein
MDKRYMIPHFDSVRCDLHTTLDKSTDADHDFKPFPDAMSVPEAILRVIHEEAGESHLGILQGIPSFPPPWPADNGRQTLDRRSLRTGDRRRGTGRPRCSTGPLQAELPSLVSRRPSSVVSRPIVVRLPSPVPRPGSVHPCRYVREAEVCHVHTA